MQKSNEDHFRELHSRRAVKSRASLVAMSQAQVRKELYRICEEFVTENDIHCPESIYQMDHIIGNAYEFIEKVCDVIGYASIKDEGTDEDE